MSKRWKKMVALGLAAVLCMLPACGKTNTSGTAGTEGGGSAAAEENQGTGGNEGISEDSPYKDKGFDLSKHEDVVMYAIGDRPEDMDMVLDKLNGEYLEPWLNTTLDMKFLSWSDVQTKYSLLLAGGEKVDLMYTSSWCNYNSEAGKGAFKELTPEFLQTYLPYSYEIQAPESWDQVMISGKIFAIPKNYAVFNNYNMIAVRKDLMEKHGIGEINSWDTMKEALYTLAEKETQNGIYANGQRGNAEFADHVWWQNIEAEPLASGFDFMYFTHGEEKLPDWDKDVFYKYTAPECLELYLEMAEMAKKNVWSPNKINDTSDAQTNFESGKTASFIWNSTIVSAGDNLEKAGIGTYEIFDVTPNTKAQRGSYADDTIAIPNASKIPERAALVLDCLKGFPEVNNLVVGGIEGVHYEMTEDGKRKLGEAADRYGWGSWAWGITGKDSPQLYSDDPRSSMMDEICTAKEYTPVASGFTFDKKNVEAELAVIGSIVQEYGASFNIGLFGDETEAKYQEFVGKLEEAGLSKVMEECRVQYEAFCERKGQE